MNIFMSEAFHVSVTNVSSKTVYLLKKMVIVRDVEFPTFVEQHSGTSVPKAEKCEVNEVNRPSESKNLLMRIHDVFKRDEKKSLKQERCDYGKIDTA